MGKSRAEIQRAYRQRKKEKEGESYLERERQRIRKYYTPIEERPQAEQKTRRDKVRKYVQEHRMRKRAEKTENERSIQDLEIDQVEDENGVSSTTASTSKMVVKLPKFDSKERTRKRMSRAVARQHREIEQLKKKNNDLQRSYKRVSKRFERLAKKAKVDNSTADDKPENDEEVMNPESSLTPRKRLAKDLRNVGVSPSKIPRTLKTAMLFGNVIGNEIDSTRKQNGRKGRKVLANIVSGKLLKKYRMKSFMNKATGISRKIKERFTNRCDVIPKQERQPILREEKRKKVIEFLLRDDNSRMMPGKNDKVKVGHKQEQKRVLNDNMGFLHMKYLAETGDDISFATFCRMRPKSISLKRYITKNQCLCQRHQNMALTLKCIKRCGAAIPVNPDEFVRKVDEDSINMVDFCDSFPDIIRHEQWKKVTLDDGKKRTKVVGEDVQKNEFKEKVITQIEEFRAHIMRVKQQYKAISDLKQNMPEGHVISHMDFAENFTCGTCDEVQSAYWNSNSVTLHPVVIYYRENGELKHHNYVFVSDDLGHNIGTVFAFLKKLVPEVKRNINSEVKKIHYWTDGPSSQYKNKTAFFIVSNHQELLGTDADWSYFESGHGKGACDGIGGTAKRMADLSIKQGKVSIQEAEDFFIWGNEYHKSAKYILVPSTECVSARKELENVNSMLQAVKGTMQVHHVSSIEKGRIKTMTTSCFCQMCLQGSSHMEFVESSLFKDSKTNGQNTNEAQDIASIPQPDNTQNTQIDGKEQDKILAELAVDDWVAAVYDKEWHIGQILETDEEENDYLVSFMRKNKCQRSNRPTFKWPSSVDEIWVEERAIIMRICEPTKEGRSGRNFLIEEGDMNAIEEKMHSFIC